MELPDTHGWLPAKDITIDAETEVLVHTSDGQYFLAAYDHESARLLPGVTHYQHTPHPPEPA